MLATRTRAAWKLRADLGLAVEKKYLALVRAAGERRRHRRPLNHAGVRGAGACRVALPSPSSGSVPEGSYALVDVNLTGVPSSACAPGGGGGAHRRRHALRRASGRAPTFFLHAVSLGVRHPASGDFLRIEPLSQANWLRCDARCRARQISWARGLQRMTRAIIHVDMDAFYASVEQRDVPTRQAGIVGGDLEGGGLSRVLRGTAVGVRSAIYGQGAQAGAPGDRGATRYAYVEASEAIFRVFDGTPLIGRFRSTRRSMSAARCASSEALRLSPAAS